MAEPRAPQSEPMFRRWRPPIFDSTVQQEPRSTLLSRDEDESDVNPFDPFLVQSEYGPLSYVICFLPIAEMLPIRLVCQFFQDVVRVSLGLREIGDNELIDLNCRFANYANTAQKTPLNKSIHLKYSDSFPISDHFPAELVKSFHFLASSPSLCLIHVTSLFDSPRLPVVSSIPMTVLISESLMENVEERNHSREDETHRLSSFLWAVRLCLARFDRRMTFPGPAGYGRSRPAFIFQCKKRPSFSEDSQLVSGCSEDGKEEEEEEGEVEAVKGTQEFVEDEPRMFVEIRQGTVEFELIDFGNKKQQAVLVWSGKWLDSQVSTVFQECEEKGVDPLFDAKDWVRWLQDGPSPELFFQVADRWPLVLHFLHLEILHQIGVIFNSSRTLARNLKILSELLLQRSPLPYYDIPAVFLQNLFNHPRIIQYSRDRDKVSLKGDDCGTAQLVKHLFDRGYEIKLTEKQRLVQFEGLFRNHYCAGWFWTNFMGVTWNDLFVDGTVNPLMRAALNGANHVVDHFVESVGHECLSLRDPNGKNVLHYAVLHKTRYSWSITPQEVIKTLLTLRPALEFEKDDNEDTPVETAIHSRCYNNAEFLLKRVRGRSFPIRWDLTRPEEGEGYQSSVYWRISSGLKVYKIMQRRHKVIFPIELRKKAFLRACSHSSLDIAKLILPGVDRATESTDDSEAVLCLENRQKVFSSACNSGSLVVVSFILHTIPLDQEIGGRWPIALSAASEKIEIVKFFLSFARNCSRSEALFVHFRECLPDVIVNQLERISHPLKVFPLVNVLAPLMNILDDAGVGTIVDLVEERGVSAQFFALGMHLCPSVISELAIEPDLMVELLCDALARNTPHAASAIISSLKDVTREIPKSTVGCVGGWVNCKALTPLCLLLHADFEDAATAVCTLLADNPEELHAQIFKAAQCMCFLPNFMSRRPSFELLLQHPNLRALLDADETIPKSRVRFLFERLSEFQ